MRYGESLFVASVEILRIVKANDCFIEQVETWCLKKLADISDLTGPNYRGKATITRSFGSNSVDLCHVNRGCYAPVPMENGIYCIYNDFGALSARSKDVTIVVRDV